MAVFSINFDKDNTEWITRLQSRDRSQMVNEFTTAGREELGGADAFRRKKLIRELNELQSAMERVGINLQYTLDMEGEGEK